ncbi:MAG: TonB-dependent receptor, partial [Desulfobacterales bacterium]|nr:TonB-dependent receptor [Desulfobacterales bacterium]
NRFVLGYTPLLSRAAQTDAIDEDTGSLALRYHTDYALWGLDHELLGGADYFTTDYRRDALSQNERKTGDVEDLGLFLMNRWSLSDRLRVRFGYRYDRYQGSFRTDQRRRVDGLRVWVPGVPVDRRWTNSALDLGAVYDFNPANSFFASYATSFRSPNVDELALAEEDLRPQKGHHVEIGLRHRAVGRWEAALTLFQTKITDEIYFGEDPETRIILNRNYEDKTLRRGLEIEAKWYPADPFYLWANATWMKAEFENLGTRIPLVPEGKASLGLEWQIADPLLLALTGTWVGSRVDGNDEANDRFRKLAAYQVVDGKLTYTFRGVKVFAGINNIFDERYATLAYSEAYYPMPTRNYYAGAEWRF